MCCLLEVAEFLGSPHRAAHVRSALPQLLLICSLRICRDGFGIFRNRCYPFCMLRLPLASVFIGLSSHDVVPIPVLHPRHGQLFLETAQSSTVLQTL